MMTTPSIFDNILTTAYYLDALYASVGENPDLCVSDPCNRKKKKVFVIPVIASSIAVVLVLLVIFSALAINRMKRHGGNSLFSTFVIVITIH